ncbi:MAG TPA: RodZ domain-containing protein [Stenotrophomonas sp.]
MISESNPNPFEQQKGCGQYLREARQAAGLTVDEVATQLRMPLQVVRSLEQEDWQRLGAPVFVRGQLRSYARLLNVDLGPLLQQARLENVEPVKLVSHAHTPRGRRLLESVARRAVYVVITGVLVVPVWYAIRSTHPEQVGANTASLDVVPGPAGVADAGAPNPGAADATAVTASAASETKPAAPTTPYIASMTPMPRAAAPSAGLSLRFNGDSWIQVSAPDGSTVEKALVRSGEQRTYEPGRVARVVLGNATAVEVTQGGNVVDTKPFQRAAVARFAVSSDGSVVPAAE